MWDTIWANTNTAIGIIKKIPIVPLVKIVDLLLLNFPYELSCNKAIVFLTKASVDISENATG